MSRPPGPNQRFPLQGELAPWPFSQAQRHLWLSQLGGEAGTKLSVLPGPGRPPRQRPAGLACPGAVDGNPAHEHASDPGHTQTPCSRLPSPPTKTTRPTPFPGVSRGYCLFPGARPRALPQGMSPGCQPLGTGRSGSGPRRRHTGLLPSGSRGQAGSWEKAVFMENAPALPEHTLQAHGNSRTVPESRAGSSSSALGQPLPPPGLAGCPSHPRVPCALLEPPGRTGGLVT